MKRPKIIWASGRNVKLGHMKRTFCVTKFGRYVRDVEHGFIETRITIRRRSLTYRRPA